MLTEFDTFLKSCGIVREHTVRNRPQNGVAERANRLLGERITAMISEAGLFKAFWAEYLLHMCMFWIDVSHQLCKVLHLMSYEMEKRKVLVI